jgi:hypothetical protein
MKQGLNHRDAVLALVGKNQASNTLKTHPVVFCGLVFMLAIGAPKNRILSSRRVRLFWENSRESSQIREDSREFSQNKAHVVK